MRPALTDVNRIPPPPRQSPYGWPLPDRREEFKKLQVGAGGDTFRVENFKGSMISLPIVRVPINLPKYRVANGRTASAQQEWVFTHNQPVGFFDDGDPELETIQIAQHDILKSMIKEEGLLEKFKDPIQRQVEPLLLDENGFALNGNRRLCCWRELYLSDQGKYAHFGHVDVVILPHCDDQELDRIEARLQIDRDIRSDYTWDAEANMILQKQRLHGFSTQELSKLYGKKKSEIDELLGMRELAAEYLRSRNKENTWSLVRDDKYAFGSLYKTLVNISSPGDRELVKQASFSLIDDPADVGDRLYAVIPKVKEHLIKIKSDLAEAFPVNVAEPDKDAQDLFGGPASNTKTPGSDLALVAEIKKDESSIQKARETVMETIRAQDDQKEELKQADYLLKTLKKVNATVQNIAAHGLRPESTIQGVELQIKGIRDNLDTIEAWLASKRG